MIPEHIAQFMVYFNQLLKHLNVWLLIFNFKYFKHLFVKCQLYKWVLTYRAIFKYILTILVYLDLSSTLIRVLTGQLARNLHWNI